jgi:integrase
MKKEKYIVESCRYLRVVIYYKSGSKRAHFTKNITIDDFRTPAKAMEYAKAIRDQALQDIRCQIPIVNVPTVGELFKRTKVLFNVTTKTWTRHLVTYNHSIIAYENFVITDVKTSDVQASINASINKYTYDATQRVLSLWKQIFKCAAMLDLNVPDHTAAVIIPRDRKPPVAKRPVTISEADYHKFMDYLELSARYTHDKKGQHRKIRIMYLIRILHDTGMRPSEAMALNRSDIDLDLCLIHINKRVGSTVDSSRKIVSPKTPQSVRDIPISANLKQDLIKIDEDINNENLFYDIDGLPMEIDTLSGYVNRIAKHVGVTFTLYMLRHNMATDLIQSGTSARTTQDILGHANYQMSVEYARSSESDRKKAIESRKLK